MRKWLNEEFLKTAFSSEETDKIATTIVTTDENYEYDTDAGNDTEDKVFLLSITDANKYFSSGSDRECQGTTYCYAQGVSKGSNDNCRWWLRSPGFGSDCAAIVGSDGSVHSHGYDVDNDNNAVRPALWINLES